MKKLRFLAVLLVMLLLCPTAGCDGEYDSSFMGEDNRYEWLDGYTYELTQSASEIHENFYIVAVYDEYVVGHDADFAYVLILTAPPATAKINTFLVTTYDEYATDFSPELYIDSYRIERMVFNGIFVFH